MRRPSSKATCCVRSHRQQCATATPSRPTMLLSSRPVGCCLTARSQVLLSHPNSIRAMVNRDGGADASAPDATPISLTPSRTIMSKNTQSERPRGAGNRPMRGQGRRRWGIGRRAAPGGPAPRTTTTPVTTLCAGRAKAPRVRSCGCRSASAAGGRVRRRWGSGGRSERHGAHTVR